MITVRLAISVIMANVMIVGVAYNDTCIIQIMMGDKECGNERKHAT